MPEYNPTVECPIDYLNRGLAALNNIVYNNNIHNKAQRAFVVCCALFDVVPLDVPEYQDHINAVISYQQMAIDCAAA